MWKAMRKLNGLWGALASVVGIFTLGVGAALLLFENFEPKGESSEKAATVHQRVDDLVARFDRFANWVKAELAIATNRHDTLTARVAENYSATNLRLDQQNALIGQQNAQIGQTNVLMVEVLKEVREIRKHQSADASDSGWSLIDNAHAATVKAAAKK